MINQKEYVLTLLKSSAELVNKLGKSGKIMNAYPNKVETFPMVVYEDMNQSDVEFYDNLPFATNCNIRIHIFTKVSGSKYPTTTEIGLIVHDVFRNDFWSCTANMETSDVDDSIRHRIMDFTRPFMSE